MQDQEGDFRKFEIALKIVIIFSAMKIPVILFQKWPKKYFVMPLQLRKICFYEELFQTTN